MKKNNFIDKFKKVIWVLTPFILITIIFMLLLKCCSTQNIYSLEKNKTIIDGEVVRKPTANCRAHFAGTFLTDEKEYENISVIYQTDDFSQYVGVEKYPRNQAACPKADLTSFDTIAIEHATEVITYSEVNFKGEILLDELLAVLKINTHKQTEYSIVIDKILTKKEKESLNTIFPPSFTKIRNSNMFECSRIFKNYL